MHEETDRYTQIDKEGAEREREERLQQLQRLPAPPVP